jgi:putative ABC transport system substrate-binding protein
VEQQSQLPETVEELLSIPVDLFVCPNSSAVDAVMKLDSTTPIVFATFSHPVLNGGGVYVNSLSRPGGRITGPSQLAPGMTGKRLQLLTEIAPGISHVGAFYQPDNKASENQLEETKEAAQVLGLRVKELVAGRPSDLPEAFAEAVNVGVDALFLHIFQVVMVEAPRIARFAIDQRLPALSFQREYPHGGGLASYGASIPALYRRSAYYVDRILRGADPATLPIEQPTEWDFILNESAAQAIGLTFPPSIRLQATEIIQ